jgi:multidrug efflux pump
MLLESFILAIIAIYFLLTIKYNSFIDPLVILLGVVPLCICSAVYAMYVTDATFNIYTKIGLIMLVGLISKHGIMIVNLANAHRKATNCALKEAAIEGCVVRLRPILMTTLAMVFGALPLVISKGAGFEARHQIGWTIIGGMSFGTLLSLFLVPCLYTVLKSIQPLKKIRSSKALVN